MKLKDIESLSKCSYGKHFLLKSYSIEILLYLLENIQANGIDELLSQIKSNKPKLPAFISYISYLESKDCITKGRNSDKGSKVTIRLTDECENTIRNYLHYD